MRKVLLNKSILGYGRGQQGTIIDTHVFGSRTEYIVRMKIDGIILYLTKSEVVI